MKWQVLLPLTMLLSCRSTQRDSALKHEVNSAVETDAKYGWTVQPFPEFLAELQVKPENVNKSIFPDDTPMATRLQYWVNKIDNEIRSKDTKGIFQHIPKPQVRLMNYPEENAFVKIAWIQFDNVKFSLNDAEPADFKPTEYAVAPLSGNYMYDKREGHVEHATVKDLKVQLGRIHEMFPECDLNIKEYEGGNILVTPKSRECSFAPEITENPTQALTLILPTTGSDFVVYSGLLKSIPDEEGLQNPKGSTISADPFTNFEP